MARTWLLSVLTALSLAVWPSPGSLAGQLPADNSLRREAFLSTHWRLASQFFAVHRAGGFPITFYADGSVTTANLGGVVRWELVGDTLVLHGTNQPLYRFEWSPDYEMFHSCPLTTGPPMVIYPSQAVALMGRLNYCADQPMERSNLECRLEVTPERSRVGDPLEFRYVITAPQGERVSGRYLRLDEAIFGHSLRIVSESGEEYRFLRTVGWSYLAHFTADTGDAVPVTYRFLFPSQQSGDAARLVTLENYRRAGNSFDSLTAAWYQAAFAAGKTSIPPGTYEVTARLLPWIYATQSRSPNPNLLPDISRFAPLACRPARFIVAP